MTFRPEPCSALQLLDYWSASKARYAKSRASPGRAAMASSHSFSCFNDQVLVKSDQVWSSFQFVKLFPLPVPTSSKWLSECWRILFRCRVMNCFLELDHVVYVRKAVQFLLIFCDLIDPLAPIEIRPLFRCTSWVVGLPAVIKTHPKQLCIPGTSSGVSGYILHWQLFTIFANLQLHMLFWGHNLCKGFVKNCQVVLRQVVRCEAVFMQHPALVGVGLIWAADDLVQPDPTNEATVEVDSQSHGTWWFKTAGGMQSTMPGESSVMALSNFSWARNNFNHSASNGTSQGISDYFLLRQLWLQFLGNLSCSVSESFSSKAADFKPTHGHTVSESCA